MASRRPSITTWPCKVTGKHFEGVAGPPLRARHVSRTGVGGAASRGWHRPCCTVPHSGGDGFPLGSWCNRTGRESQARDGVAPPSSEHQMPVPACGRGRARAERPRARRSPLEGGVYARAGRSPLEGGVYPRAKRSPLEGTFEWATSVGRGGYRGVGRALCARLSKMRLALVFLQVLSGISPVVSGDPQGCPRHSPRNHRDYQELR
jgi:hypothetical protein